MMLDMPTDGWEKATDELRALIGEVSLNLAAVEEGIDWILIDLLALPHARPFFRQHILGRMMLRRKVELLREFVKSHGDLLADAPSALEWLWRIDDACEQRNRPVHDLHGGELRRWFGHSSTGRQKDGGQTINLDDYRELASNTSLLTGPAFDALFESIFHVGQDDDGEIDDELTGGY